MKWILYLATTLLLLSSLTPSACFGLDTEFAEEAPADISSDGNGREDKPRHTLSATLAFVTDYRFRGLSQTMRHPAVHGILNYVHQNGIYLGVFGSNIDGTSNLYNNCTFEIDLYGGYKAKILPCSLPELECNIGVLYFIYPGAKTYAPRSISYNTAQYNIEISYKWFSLAWAQMFTNYFAICSQSPPFNWKKNHFDKPNGSSKGSPYVEVNLSFDLWEKLTFCDVELGKLNLKLHAGYQWVRHYSQLNYADWLAVLSQEFKWFTLSVTYVGTNVKDHYYNIPDHSYHPNIQRCGGQGFIGSLVKSF